MYTVTTQNANNTNLEVDIMSLTVLANEFQDGEILEFDFVTASKQNSGSSTTLNYKIKVAGQEIALAGTQNVSNADLTGRMVRHYRLKRCGDDLLVFAGTQVGYGCLVGGITTQTQFFSGVDFTQDIDIAISAQWGVAHPDVYLNVLNARANKF